jgi:ZIP family zinc transporter
VSAVEDLFVQLAGSNPLWQSLAGGVIIAACNVLGALGVLGVRKPSESLLDGALGFAAGVMLAASFTSLILPGIERGGLAPVLVGLLLGALVLDRSNLWVPRVHFLVTGTLGRNQASGAPHLAPPERTQSPSRAHGALGRARTGSVESRLTTLVLFMVAISLHNIPEGLAVGVGFGSDSLGNALALTAAIGLQNIPEGFAVSVAARDAGLGDLSYAAFTSTRAGLVELPLALLGAGLVAVATPLLPYAMGFAAGAMLYIITAEIVPETQAKGHRRMATLGTMAGLAVMLSLDVALA